MSASSSASADAAARGATDSMAVQLGGHQNKAWAENKSSFGFKMLQKMGWSEGKGLGKHEDGQKTHTRIQKRHELEEGLGIGAKTLN